MANKNNPAAVRLSAVERQMLAEVTRLLGFHSASDTIRHAIRHEHSALMTALTEQDEVTV